MRSFVSSLLNVQIPLRIKPQSLWRTSIIVRVKLVQAIAVGGRNRFCCPSSSRGSGCRHLGNPRFFVKVEIGVCGMMQVKPLGHECARCLKFVLPELNNQRSRVNSRHNHHTSLRIQRACVHNPSLKRAWRRSQQSGRRAAWTTSMPARNSRLSDRIVLYSG